VGKKRDNIKQSMDTIHIRDLHIEVDNLSLFQFRSYSLHKNAFVEKTDKVRVVEAIPADTHLKYNLDVRLAYRESDKESFKGVEELLDLSTTLRDHYRLWIKQECDFLKNYPSPEIDPVIDFYESLLKKLDNGSILLNMGYGTGWEGKTGTFLKNNRYMWERSILDYLKSCRRDSEKRSHRFTRILNDWRYLKCPQGHAKVSVSRYDDSKVYCRDCRKDYVLDDLNIVYPYPKSRKFVFSQRTLLPPGWLEISPLNAEG
jgi:hypothetical protein